MPYSARKCRDFWDAGADLGAKLFVESAFAEATADKSWAVLGPLFLAKGASLGDIRYASRIYASRENACYLRGNHI
jgi:hypothetical protein